jgi:hypothetical protein
MRVNLASRLTGGFYFKHVKIHLFLKEYMYIHVMMYTLSAQSLNPKYFLFNPIQKGKIIAHLQILSDFIH